MSEFLDSNVAQTGGYLTVLSSFSLWIVEELSQYEIHDFFQGAMAFGGAIFLFYKIANIRIDYKLKKKLLKDDDCDCSKKGSDEEL